MGAWDVLGFEPDTAAPVDPWAVASTQVDQAAAGHAINPDGSIEPRVPFAAPFAGPDSLQIARGSNVEKLRGTPADSDFLGQPGSLPDQLPTLSSQPGALPFAGPDTVTIARDARAHDTLASIGRVFSAGASGAQEGFGPGPVSPSPEVVALAQMLRIAPTQENLNVFNATTGFLVNTVGVGVDLAFRTAGAVIHGGTEAARQTLEEEGVEHYEAKRIAETIGQMAEYEMMKPEHKLPAGDARANVRTAQEEREHAAGDFTRAGFGDYNKPVAIEAPEVAENRATQDWLAAQEKVQPTRSTAQEPDAGQEVPQQKPSPKVEWKVESTQADDVLRGTDEEPWLAPVDLELGTEPTHPLEEPARGSPKVATEVDDAHKRDVAALTEEAVKTATLPRTEEFGAQAAAIAARQAKPKPSKPAKPSLSEKEGELLDQIRARGGINVTQGDHADIPEILKDYKNPPFKRRLLNPNGLLPDDMRKSLQSDGWFGGSPDKFGPTALAVGNYPGDDIRDLAGKISDSVNGTPVYHPEAAPPERAYDPVEHEHFLQSRANAVGAEPRRPTETLEDFDARIAEREAIVHEPASMTDLADEREAEQHAGLDPWREQYDPLNRAFDDQNRRTAKVSGEPQSAAQDAGTGEEAGRSARGPSQDVGDGEEAEGDREDEVPSPGTRQSPVELHHEDDIGAARAEVEPNPSEGQREAGNYSKGHARIQGMDVAIETPKGAARTGTGGDGKPWSNVNGLADYGYIKRTEGADGEHVDTYIGPNPASDKAFVFDQYDPKTGAFDEHKTVLGVDTAAQAKAVYDAGFSDGSGPSRRKAMRQMSVPEFKDYLANGDLTKPAVTVLKKTGTDDAVASVEHERGIDLGGVRVSPDDLSYDLARRAHQATSFDPERRAKQEQQSYVDEVQSLYESASKLAETPEQKAVLARELEQYRQGLLKKYQPVLAARSRTMSSMITGPARFPVARNEKALRAERSRTEEFTQWRNKARAAVIRAIKDARSGEQATNDDWAQLKKVIDRDLSIVKDIENGAPQDRSAFTNSVSGRLRRLAASGEHELVARAIGYVRDEQKKLKRPFFAETNSVWDLGQQAKEAAAAPKETGSKTIAEFEGAAVINDRDAERVRINFETQSGPEIRQALKGEGWHWSPANRTWQRKNTPAAEQSAARILSKFFEPKGSEAPKFQRATEEPGAEDAQGNALPQQVIPGAERMTEEELRKRDIARRMEGKQQGKPGQKAVHGLGLFGGEAEATAAVKKRDQGSLFRRGEEQPEAPTGTKRVRLSPYIEADIKPSEAFTEHEAELTREVNEILARMAPSVQVQGASRLHATEATGAPGQVQGAYQKEHTPNGVAHVIAWSLESPDAVGSARHEALHYLIDRLTPEERATLEEDARKEDWNAKHNIDSRYEGFDEKAKTEEGIAEEFSKWRRSGRKGWSDAIHRIFNKLDVALRRIAAAVRRILGKKATTADIFTRMETGEIGKRASARGARGDQGARLQTAYHGSPHDFDEFDTSKIGTGEGAQVYGHGLYFAGKKEVAEYYRDTLSRNRNLTNSQLEAYFKPGHIVHGYGGSDKVLAFHPKTATQGWSVDVVAVDKNGNKMPGAFNRNHATPPSNQEFERVTGKKLGKLYHVDLKPKEDEYLDWDKPMSQQSDHVKSALEKAGFDISDKTDLGEFGGHRIEGVPTTGGEFYQHLSRSLYADYEKNHWARNPAKTSTALKEAGIPGIRYADQLSRNTDRTRLESAIKGREAELANLQSEIDMNQGNDGLLPRFFERRREDIAQIKTVIAGLRSKLADLPEPTHNYVIFDAKDAKIEAKFQRSKKPAAAAAGTAPLPGVSTPPPPTKPLPKPPSGTGGLGLPSVAEPVGKKLTDWEDDLHRIKQNNEADRLKALQYLQGLPAELRDTGLQERFYLHKEEGTSLTPSEQKLYDKYVAPIMKQAKDTYDRIRKDGYPASDEGYVHRIVKGKGSMYDEPKGALGDNPIFGAGNRSLSKKAPSLHGRSIFMGEGDKGTLELVSGQKYKPDDTYENAATGEKFTVRQATTREIEARTPLEYHKNALVNSLDNLTRLRRAERNIQFLEHLKKDPTFLENALPQTSDKIVPPDWRTTDLPQLAGWRMNPRLANLFNDFYGQRGKGGAIGDVLGKINHAVVSSIFVNPLSAFFGHGLNVATHWYTGRGWDNFLPQTWGKSAVNGMRAIRDVATLSPRYIQMMREGTALQYAPIFTADFHKAMIDMMQGEMKKAPADWLDIAKRAGTTPVAVYNWLSKISRKGLWSLSDVLALQRIYDLQGNGLKTRDAIRIAEREIPNYRIPTESWEGKGGRAFSELMQNQNVLIFGRYRYAMLRAYADTLKQGFARGSSGKDRINAAGQLLALAVLVGVLYPLADQALKAISGNKDARVRRSGPATLIDNLSSGEKSFGDSMSGLFAPAPGTLAAVQALPFINRQVWNGQRVYNPEGSLAEDAGELGYYGATQFSPVNELSQVLRKTKTPGEIGAQWIGAKLPGPGEAARAKRAKAIEGKRETTTWRKLEGRLKRGVESVLP